MAVNNRIIQPSGAAPRIDLKTAFLGSHDYKMDAKGRLSLPADFRTALSAGRTDKREFDFVFIPHPNKPVLVGARADLLLDKIQNDVDLHIGVLAPCFNKQAFDNGGRFVLYKPLREHLQLDSSQANEIKFIGRGHVFDVIRADLADEHAVLLKDFNTDNLVVSHLEHLRWGL